MLTGLVRLILIIMNLIVIESDHQRINRQHNHQRKPKMTNNTFLNSPNNFTRNTRNAKSWIFDDDNFVDPITYAHILDPENFDPPLYDSYGRLIPRPEVFTNFTLFAVEGSIVTDIPFNFAHQFHQQYLKNQKDQSNPITQTQNSSLLIQMLDPNPLVPSYIDTEKICSILTTRLKPTYPIITCKIISASHSILRKKGFIEVRYKIKAFSQSLNLAHTKEAFITALHLRKPPKNWSDVPNLFIVYYDNTAIRIETGSYQPDNGQNLRASYCAKDGVIQKQSIELYNDVVVIRLCSFASRLGIGFSMLFCLLFNFLFYFIVV